MKLEFCTYGHQFSFVFALLCHSLLSIYFWRGDLEVLLRVLPGSIAGAQLTIYLGETIIHEFLGLASLLVFLIVGTLVISVNQSIHIIDTTQHVLIGQRDIGHIGDLLVGCLKGGTANESISHLCGRGDGDLQGIAALIRLGQLGRELALLDGQRACFGLDGGREGCKGLLGKIGLFLILD